MAIKNLNSSTKTNLMMKVKSILLMGKPILKKKDFFLRLVTF